MPCFAFVWSQSGGSVSSVVSGDAKAHVRERDDGCFRTCSLTIDACKLRSEQCLYFNSAPGLAYWHVF